MFLTENNIYITQLFVEHVSSRFLITEIPCGGWKYGDGPFGSYTTD